jgi:putative transcriptional regulator
MGSLLKERFARLGPIPALRRNLSGSRAVVVLRPERRPAEIHTIDATLALARRGATMLRAKRALEAVLERGFSVLDLPLVEDADALRQELGQAGIASKLVAAPRPVDLAALRQRLLMTREQFALAYGLDPETLRNWEAGRRDPGPARAYLQAIENDPEGVLDAYTGAKP